MSKRKRRRKSGSQKKQPKTLIVVLIFGLIGLSGSIGWMLMDRNKAIALHEYSRQWEHADGMFRRRSKGMVKAYEEIVANSNCEAWVDQYAKVKQLAELMTRTAKGIQSGDVDSLVKCREALDQSIDQLSFVYPEYKVLNKAERIEELEKWANAEVAKAIATLEPHDQLPVVNSLAVAREQLDQWQADAVNNATTLGQRWVEQGNQLQVPTDPLRVAVGRVQQAGSLVAALEVQVTACETAIGSLKQSDLLVAIDQWESLQRTYPAGVTAEFWTDYLQQLRDSLRNQLKPIAAVAGDRPPGNAIPSGPPRIDVSSVVTAVPASASDSGKVCFVRVHNHCYALDSATGHVHWVIDVGYGETGLPQLIDYRERQLVSCFWHFEKRDAISVLDAANGKPLWSFALPPGLHLSGPPVVHRSRICLMLSDGRLWIFDVLDGSPQFQLQLPEPVRSPMAVREDGAGVLIIGDQLGIYLLDLAATPQVVDVLLPNKTANTLSSRGIWIPPFAVVFQNELDDSCKTLVYRTEGQHYGLVQAAEISGRVWDVPAVVGEYLLVETDAVIESIQSIDIDARVDPLKVRFTSTSPVDHPVRPCFVGHHDAPFLSMHESTLTCFQWDALATRKNPTPRVRWKQEFPWPDCVPIQQLQTHDQLVIAAAQSPGQRSVIVRASSIESGDVAWTQVFGGEVVSVQQYESEVMLRTDASQLVRVEIEPDGTFDRTTLDVGLTGSEFAWLPERAHIVRASAAPDRIETLEYFGEQVSQLRVSSLPASPLLVKRPVQTSPSDSEDAPLWCLFVDNDHRVQLLNIDRDTSDVTVQYYQLTEEPDGPWNRPIWLANGNILVSHQSGIAYMFSLSSEDGANFLKRIDRREHPLAPLSGPPVAVADRLWAISASGKASVLDGESLLEIGTIDLPVQPTSNAASSQMHLIVGLGDGRIAMLDFESGVQMRLTQVSDVPIRNIKKIGRGLLVTDDRGTIHLVKNDGSYSGGSVPAPISHVVPIEFANRFFVATTSGVWHSVSKSKSQVTP